MEARESSRQEIAKGRVPAMLPEDAVRAMSKISKISLREASERMGSNRRSLDTALRETDATRAKGARLPCGPRADTLALAARAMGFRLALVGHGTVIEVVPGRRSADE
jgi:hypothetical protein